MTFQETDLRYLASHEWAAVSADTAIVGISDHAQKELGDIVFVELPAVGTMLKKGEEFGTIESTKAASQLYAPLSGKVLEINSAVSKSPELINKDPYGKGWLVKIRISNKAEIATLLDHTQYSQSLV